MYIAGLEVPQASDTAEPEKKKRVVYGNKKKKPQVQKQESTEGMQIFYAMCMQITILLPNFVIEDGFSIFCKTDVVHIAFQGHFKL